jgi:hypothetical protein
LHFAIFNPLGCPGLMPGNIKQSNWSGSKIFLWRIFFLILLIIVTPILVLIGGPIIMVAFFSKSSCFRRGGCWTVLMVILAILTGILIEPLVIVVAVIGKE